MKPLIKIIFILVLIFSLGGCATPQNIKEKSLASLQLYKNVAIASQNFSYALNNELKTRDRYEHQLSVRNCDEEEKDCKALLAFVTAPKMDENTEKVMKTFALIQLEFEQARMLHGVVDRFLRIDVVDLDDAKELSSRANNFISE